MHLEEGAPGPGLRVMLVDDHDRAREALARRLAADRRITVVGATASLDDARALVDAHAPHAALIDTRRQDGQGAEVISALATAPAANRPLVVAYTSYFDASEWRRLQAAGAQEWLLKEIDIEVLFNRLRDAVHRELPSWRWDGCC